MAKKKSKIKQELSSFSGEGLATLGEKLKSSNPDLVERFEAIQGIELTVPRLVQVMEDLLPYPWGDIELFEEAIKLTAQGFYGEAVAVCGDVLRLSPNAYPAYHLLGCLLYISPRPRVRTSPRMPSLACTKTKQRK